MSRLLALIFILGSCFIVPTISAAADQIDSDLVRQGRSQGETIWRRGFTLAEPALEQKLQRFVDTLTVGRTIDPEIKLKVAVLRSPDPNAFALPDGSIFIFAGLLSALNSWDQVAFVLAHEAEHAISWHAQKNISQAKSKTAVFQVLSLGASVALGSSGVSGAGLIDEFTQLGLGLAAAASVNGYGRDLESDADMAGCLMTRDAGFDSCAPVEALNVLLDEKREGSRLANIFWGNHPLTKDRIRDIRERFSAPCDGDTSAPAPSYEATKWAMTKVAAELWVGAGDSRHGLEAAKKYVAANPSDPDIHRVMGDGYAASASDDTLRLASAEYERALQLSGGTSRLPLRGLAYVAEKQADTTAAIRWLDTYLAGDEPVPERRAMKRKVAFFRTRFPLLPVVDSLSAGPAEPDSAASADSLAAAPNALDPVSLPDSLSRPIPSGDSSRVGGPDSPKGD